MDIHSHYVKKAGLLPRGKDSPQLEASDIPDENHSKRLAEARRITKLFSDHKAYSFLRLGDMELTMLLAYQDGFVEEVESAVEESGREIISGTAASGGPGIGMDHANRLWKAFSGADYVDFHEVLRVNAALLPELRLDRSPLQDRNPDKWTSYILPFWVMHEFQSFCDNNSARFGIAGAEASMLEWLSQRAEFKEMASGIWPKTAQVFLHQVRENGKNLSENLDLIKSDLKKFIEDNQLDTLFLSLGGGAKILCHELSKECRIRAIDFGAMTRAMCDLGSYGNMSSRSSHSIQLYRLPCRLVINGIFSTCGDFGEQELLAKYHAQLIHQLAPERLGYSRGNSQLDLSISGRKRFLRAWKDLKKDPRYRGITSSPNSRKEMADFNHFCGTHMLTLTGFLFLIKFKLKRLLLNIVQFSRSKQ